MRTVRLVSPCIPPEWVAAHGLHPVRTWGQHTDHIATGVCPFAAAALQCPGHDPLILTSTCDQLRRCWDQFRRGPTFMINVPATTTDHARQLYEDELLRLGQWLIRIGGMKPESTELYRICKAYDTARAQLRRQRETLSARTYAAGVADIQIDEPVKILPATLPQGIPLAIVGGPMREQDLWIYDHIESHGGRIALDATETGERLLPAPLREDLLAQNPLAALIDAYFNLPDVFRRPNDVLYDYLERETHARNVRGIYLVRHLWCDLWHAELARMREKLKLPIIELDLGDRDTHLERTRTRIESLLDVLR